MFDVCVDDPFDEVAVGHSTETFVVHNNVKVSDPVGLLVDVCLHVSLGAVIQDRPGDIADAF